MQKHHNGRLVNTLRKPLAAILAALVLGFTLGSASPALGQSITLISGNGAVNTPDAGNQVTLDGGQTFQSAVIVSPSGAWHTIPGTQYIYCATAIFDPCGLNTTIRYRTSFQLPSAYTGPSLAVSIHADNAAKIYLNGNLIGQQPQAALTANFQNPAEQYNTNNPAFFQPGTNLLEFDVADFGVVSGLDYEATVTFTPVIQVDIDIKPGSDPNSFSLGAKGTVSVAILSTSTFDAATVDPSTVTLAGAPVRAKPNGGLMAALEDVDGDGLADLVLHFSISALQLTPGDTQAALSGLTFSGNPISGVDSVRLVP